MKTSVTFMVSARGAFRVEVTGIGATNVAEMLLTGSGDDHDLELEDGPHIAEVTDIASGKLSIIPFTVDSHVPDQVVQIGDKPKASNLVRRSLGGTDTSSHALPSPNAHPDRLVRRKPPKGVKIVGLEYKSDKGWRAFRSADIARGTADTSKISRPSDWTRHPVVRLNGYLLGGQKATCFVPLYKNGTLITAFSGWASETMVVGPSEARAAVIVGGLNNSLQGEVGRILQWATGGKPISTIGNALLKKDDPWLSAATGLLLAGAGRPKDLGPAPISLSEQFGWISDLGVLAAYCTAASDPEQEKACLARLQRARKDGKVYYWRSFDLADQLLLALISGARDPALRTKARLEYGAWKRLKLGATRVGSIVAWLANSAHEASATAKPTLDPDKIA